MPPPGTLRLEYRTGISGAVTNQINAQFRIANTTSAAVPPPRPTECPPGMVLVGLESQGRRAVITGDLLHTVLQLAFPGWSTRFCADPAQSRATRRAFLESVADTDTLVVPAHFPEPTAGWVRRSGDAYDFRFADTPLP